MTTNPLINITSREISSIGREIFRDHTKAINLIEKGKPNLNQDDIFALKQFQTSLEFIPASDAFMKKVKKVFNDKQINFTIQNYLTWHYIDSILLTFFKTGDRFEKLKACAVTDVDDIFIQGLEFMLSLKDMTMDEIRFEYFKFIGPKYLPYLYFYNKTDDEIAEDLKILYEKAPNTLDVTTEYALQLLLTQAPQYHFMLQTSLAARKSKFGALPTKLNEQYFGNILYKGLTGQFKPMEKGEIIVKHIARIDDIKSYFNNRRNAYQMLSERNIKINAAYINGVVVGVIGFREQNGTVVNIHVDGDYRYKGIAKKLLAETVKQTHILTVIPVGDSLDFVKRISKYDKRRNIGIVTLDTLEGSFEKKDYPKGITIRDSEIKPIDIVSNTFKSYLEKNYNLDSLSVKEAKIEDERIGYIIFDKNEKKIAVIEVYDKYSNMGIGKMILNSVLDYNVWSADIAKTGVLFWAGKGVISGSIVYLSKSDSKLKQFTKKNKIITSVPQFHIDL